MEMLDPNDYVCYFLIIFGHGRSYVLFTVERDRAEGKENLTDRRRYGDRYRSDSLLLHAWCMDRNKLQPAGIPIR